MCGDRSQVTHPLADILGAAAGLAARSIWCSVGGAAIASAAGRAALGFAGSGSPEATGVRWEAAGVCLGDLGAVVRAVPAGCTHGQASRIVLH